MLARALSLLLLLTAGAHAAEAPGPLQSLQVGEARLDLRRDGSFALTQGATTLVTDGRLLLFGPNWEGSDQRAAAVEEAGAGARIRCRLTEKASGKAVEIAQQVTRAANGFRFEYAVKPLAPMTLNELSLVLDLPIETFKGKRLLLAPRVASRFPVERPANRHFVSAACTHFVFGAGPPNLLTLALDEPAACNVQDTREWNGTQYQAFVKLHAGLKAVGPDDHWRLAFTLIPNDPERRETPVVDLNSDKPLRLGAVRVEPEAPRVGRTLTLHVDLQGTWKTPFWQEEVALDALFRGPDGREVRVPGFYTQEYARKRAGASPGMEVLTPAGAPEWQVRFLPESEGSYDVLFQAKDRAGKSVEERRRIVVAAGQRRPFVRVSRTDPHYFELDNGEPYFANGLNVCWYRPTGGTYDYDRWFGRLSEAGGNFARLWMPEWAQGFEWGRPGEYRLDRAWQMDAILRLAEEKGIRIKLCLENFRSFTAGNPYAKANGGPCDRVMEFFTHPEAKRMWRNRLRYAAARWGYSPNLLAWEFWNEINCVAEGETDPATRYNAKVVQAWANEMAPYLRQTDAGRHLIVNSLGSFQLEPELWASPQIDFAQMHGYWHPTLAASREQGKDMAQMMAERVAQIRGFGKPALFAEFGLVNDKWGLSPRVQDDPEGVHLHNGLWGAMMAGAAGTAHLWWWDNYVDPQELWGQFRGVAGFSAGVPWARQGFQPLTARAEPTGLRVMGLRGRDMLLLWAQNRAHTWWNVAEKQPIPPVEGGRIMVPAPAAAPTGRACTVEFWDTTTGRRTDARQVTPGPDGLAIDVGAVAKDVALKVLTP